MPEDVVHVDGMADAGVLSLASITIPSFAGTAVAGIAASLTLDSMHSDTAAAAVDPVTLAALTRAASRLRSA